jgi:hypothetical protein
MGAFFSLIHAYSFYSATSKFPLSSWGASTTLSVLIRKDTTQKRDSFDCFSDMSALYGSISPLEYEDKEKVLTLGHGDAHALTLDDVSGMLPDYKESDHSSFSLSSASSASDTESVGGEEEVGEEEGEIEVSSLHRASVGVQIPIPTTRPSRHCLIPAVY